MGYASWFPIIAFFLLIFLFGGIGMIGNSVTGININDINPNSLANETYYKVTGIIKTMNKYLPSAQDNSTFFENLICNLKRFPSIPIPSCVINSQDETGSIENDLIDARAHPTIYSFVLGIGLLPEYVLYPLMTILGTLLIVQIIVFIRGN